MAGLICAVVVGFGVAIGQSVTNGPVFLTSLASSGGLIASAPKARACRTRAILISHIASMLSGVLVRAVLPAGPIAVALSVAIALTLLLLCDALHPPALANAGFVFVTGAAAVELLTLASATALLLAAAALASRRLGARGVLGPVAI